MLRSLRSNVFVAPNKCKLQNMQVRSFWEYVNMMFNRIDMDRLKKFGPDRTCAEWVLRNGGKIVWDDGKTLADYNSLPPETQTTKQVVEIDASGSSISHYGFAHLNGCEMLRKMILHNSDYIDDRAMTGLSYGPLLSHVQVSKCINVTDTGLKELKDLSNLKNLVLFGLEGVTDLEMCKMYIKQHLPKCKIQGADNEMKQNV